MLIPPKVILLWTGSNASIPSGYSRVTALDGKFSKGAHGNSSQNVTGGANSHSHTSPAHSHTIQDHTHTYQLNTVGSDTDDCASNAGNLVTGSHSHGSATTNSTSASSSSSDSLTYGSVAGSSLPPYYEVIFIKSTVSNNLPTNAIGLFNDLAANVPTGWYICNGGDSTPDLRGKYLRGASTGADAGATGGATTHSHVMDHSHASGALHTHHCDSATNSGGFDTNSGGSSDIAQNHQHHFTTDAAVATIAAYTGTNALSDTAEPLHKKLHAIMKSATGQTARGLIGLFLDDITLLPAGWFVCDGTNGTPDMRDYHLKIATVDGDVGGTGGSNTHTHAATSHSHGAGASHTHTGTSDGHVRTMAIDGAGSDHTNRATGRPHSMINVSSSTPLHDSANTTANSSNNEPEYLTVHFIQFQKEIGAAALIASLL